MHGCISTKLAMKFGPGGKPSGALSDQIALIQWTSKQLHSQS